MPSGVSPCLPAGLTNYDLVVFIVVIEVPEYIIVVDDSWLMNIYRDTVGCNKNLMFQLIEEFTCACEVVVS